MLVAFANTDPTPGEKILPGTWGTEFIFPNPATITTLRGQGYNTFRVQLKMERLTPGSLTGGFNNAYLQNLTNVVNHITQSGGWAVLDPHNYGRFYNAVITDVAGFQTWWVNFANQFRGNDRVVFDTNNEYYGMDQTLVLNLNQAAINGIRSTGATQYIFVEGNQWSGAWSWTAVNDNMKALADPLNKLVYEMHQYLDSDSSGTSPKCVSTTIGVERVQAATAWLRQNGKIGILGEFAGGANPQCQAAVKGLLDYLKANSDVWSGALWWAAGPWWDDYLFSFEPPSGTGYQYYNSLLKDYLA
ncbi:Endoglucanase gh5-1 [Colletotrichum tanaceti]|uniref:cellulase n=1 Tax=Colletotrichum tanaceti TaxID=1306861 RepID=A0A4U6XNT3_9PEZI|nr:Endoglucanase gh5-1 [Colletotrichum tanaceti]TKW57435.1 Endoglucanase gh5-1 [Colletotrichum tanaceti]